MSLRDQARTDLAVTLEALGDWGIPVTITDPAGTAAVLSCQVGDIAHVIDPQTGMAVTGRMVSCTARVTSLQAEFPDLPKAVAKGSSKPWRADFDGKTCTVNAAYPDFQLGVVAMTLEFYNAAGA